jgi:hypothetical protein
VRKWFWNLYENLICCFSINNVGHYKFFFDTSLKENPLSYLEKLTYVYRELDEFYMKSHPIFWSTVTCLFSCFHPWSCAGHPITLGLSVWWKWPIHIFPTDRYLIHILLQISYIECAKFQLCLFLYVEWSFRNKNCNRVYNET